MAPRGKCIDNREVATVLGVGAMPGSKPKIVAKFSVSDGFGRFLNISIIKKTDFLFSIKILFSKIISSCENEKDCFF